MIMRVGICTLLAACLLAAGCDPGTLMSFSAAPAARFEIWESASATPGTNIFCPVDHTGLGDGAYDDLPNDALLIGHRATGGNDRCRIDLLNRYNGYLAFDLSRLATPAPTSVGTRQITGALMSANITRVPYFSGGAPGCRLSRSGMGMLDGVFWLASPEFFPDREPDLSNPPPATRIGTLSIDGSPVSLNRWWQRANPPLEVLGTSPGAMTLSLDDRALAGLQQMVDRRSPGLRRFGLYFAGTNSGVLGSNQACLQVIENVRFTVVYRDDR